MILVTGKGVVYKQSCTFIIIKKKGYQVENFEPQKKGSKYKNSVLLKLIMLMMKNFRKDYLV